MKKTPKNKEDLKKGEDLKNENDLKMKTTSKIFHPLQKNFAPPLKKLPEIFFDDFSLWQPHHN